MSADDAKPELRGRRRRGLGLLVGIAALGAVIVAVTRVSEPRDFMRLIKHAEPWWLAVALALQAGTYIALASVWRAVARAARQPLGLGPAVRIALAKLFVDQTLPSGGISGGALLVSSLGRRGMPHSVVGATLIVDLASYYFAYAIGLGVALAVAAASRDVSAIVVAPALVFVAIAIGIALGAIGLSRAHRVPKLPGLRRVEHWLTGADRRLTGDVRLIARATRWQLAIVALDGATMWTLLRAVDVHAPLAGVFASFMIASLARTLSITPAGLGVFEGVGVLTLSQVGVSNAAALSATLLFRGLSYWLPMIPGFIAARDVRRD